MRILLAAVLGLSVASGAALPVFAVECTEDADCADGGECIDGVCIWTEPGLCVTDADCPEGASCVDGVCMSTCETDADCPEGWSCMDGMCGPNQNPEPTCATSADCAEGQDCIKGYCFPHEAGMCDADDDCAEGEVCAWHSCMPAEEFCTEDADCAAYESCQMDCVLYAYDPEGGMSEECEDQLGFCYPDLAKVEVPQECSDFCAHVAPCIEEGSSEPSEGGGSGSSEEEPVPDDKGDDITDATPEEMCGMYCAISLLEEASKEPMESFMECVLKYDTCEEMQSECQDEAVVVDEAISAETGGPEPPEGSGEPQTKGGMSFELAADGNAGGGGGGGAKNEESDSGGGTCSMGGTGTGLSGVALLLALAGLALALRRRLA